MGAMVARLFSDAGYSVIVGDTVDGPISYKPIADCDVVVVSVPIPVMESALERLGPLTRKDGVVLDIASVKQAPVEAMLRHCKGQVIGSHPLFGPLTESPADHVWFGCRARSDDGAFEWFRDFVEDTGARFVEIDPLRHDKLMAAVQVLRHLLLFCFGRGLMGLGFDPASELESCGPWFGGLVEMLRRQVAQKPELYADIALGNPHSDEVADTLLESMQEFRDLLRDRDKEGLTQAMREVSNYALDTDLKKRG